MRAVLGHGDLAASLVFIFPLFLIYEVGVLFAPAQNGVDFISRHVLSLLGNSRGRYLLVHVAMALVFIALVAWLRHVRKIDRGRFLPMLLESAIYALTLGSFILFVMRNLLGIQPLASGPELGAASGVILSIGAGVHEELVFRLGLCAGGAALCRLLGMRHFVAVAAAFLFSSSAFSLVHHLGVYGDPWSFAVFVYRTLAGLVFACLFYFRSLAHATYTHGLYDLYVLILT
ncbi:MAG: CPBP family intramembrane metalloprotease [Deltaproteobacteria bacterium]|nr:CPBP family intramembrane metalloprotease [Deltaproteobacteria bacterium]